MRNLQAIASVIATIVLFVGTANAASIAVPNYDFESPDVADGGVTTTHPSWNYQNSGGVLSSALVTFDPLNASYDDATGNTVALPGAANGYQALSNRATVGGSNALFAVNFMGYRPNVSPSIWQLEAGKIYTIRVAAAVPKDMPAGAEYGDLIPNIGNYLAIGIGDMEAYAQLALVIWTDIEANKMTLVNNKGTFIDVSASFNSDDLIAAAEATGNGGVGDNLSILFGFKPGQIDNVRLEVDVPEPSTLALLAAGLVSMVAYAWRKRR